MNSTTPAKKTEHQSLWCCNVLYRRWRFVGDQFPDVIQHCRICGKKLEWPEYTGPISLRKRALMRYYRRRNDFAKRGLASNGKQRKRPLRAVLGDVATVQAVIMELDATAAEMVKVYDLLPPESQAVVQSLGVALARLRNKIIICREKI